MTSSFRYALSLSVGCFLTTAGAFGAPHGATAQEATDSLRLQIERLAVLVDSLSREVERLRAGGQEEEAEDALARLRAAAAAAAGGARAPQREEQSFVGRQRSLQSLNPEISLNADMLAHFNTSDPDADNFIPRDFELSIQSALDPFSRAKVFFVQDTPGGEIEPFADRAEAGEGAEEGGGVRVEEGYVEWVSLPGGVGVKFGRFFQRFGTLNRWHIHALPFESRSLPHIAFFGQEPLAQSGVSVTWLAPFGGGRSGTYEATVEVTRAANDLLFGAATSPTLLGNINGFWTLSEATDLDLALTWLIGKFQDPSESFNRNVYSAEMSFNWIPPSRSRRRGLMVRAGYMVLDGLNGQGGGGAAETASGFWSMAELKLSPTWLVGARFDRVENPTDPDVTQWMTSATLTWWQSEFVRIRAEYDFLSGVQGGDGSGRFILQTTFAMGPHKHSTY